MSSNVIVNYDMFPAKSLSGVNTQYRFNAINAGSTLNDVEPVIADTKIVASKASAAVVLTAMMGISAASAIQNIHPAFVQFPNFYIAELESSPAETAPQSIIKEQKWQSYLETLKNVSDENVSPFVIEAIKKIRLQLNLALDRYVAPPAASPAEGNGISISWNFGEYFLSVDILTNNTIEWFLRNRSTEEYFGDINGTLDDFPPDELKIHLEHIKLSLV